MLSWRNGRRAGLRNRSLTGCEFESHREYQLVHMINAHDAYDQFDRVYSYVVKLPIGDFRDGVLFYPHWFQKETKERVKQGEAFWELFWRSD